MSLKTWLLGGCVALVATLWVVPASGCPGKAKLKQASVDTGSASSSTLEHNKQLERDLRAVDKEVKNNESGSQEALKLHDPETSERPVNQS